MFTSCTYNLKMRRTYTHEMLIKCVRHIQTTGAADFMFCKQLAPNAGSPDTELLSWSWNTGKITHDAISWIPKRKRITPLVLLDYKTTRSTRSYRVRSLPIQAIFGWVQTLSKFYFSCDSLTVFPTLTLGEKAKKAKCYFSYTYPAARLPSFFFWTDKMFTRGESSV